MRAFTLILVALPIALAGCALPDEVADAGAGAADSAPVAPAIAFYDVPLRNGVGYHTLEELEAKIASYTTDYPALARVVEIGRTREDRPIHAVVVENRGVPGPKLAPFFDGGHHANEVEGIETTLHFLDYILLNYATNATIRGLVDAHETWVVPLVNPDGYVKQTRGNALGVNLNRNYDLDWGNPIGSNNRAMGVLAATLDRPVESAGGPLAENPGTAAFSEPESSAIRDALTALGDRVAFYLSHHTGVACITSPWTAPNPPFPVPAEHREVLDAVLDRVESDSSEYHGGTWTWATGDCMNYSASGASQDWAYAEFAVPSFTFEVRGGTPLSVDEAERMLANAAKPEPGLPFWVQSTLPVEAFFLANAGALKEWRADFVAPPLPEGLPPEREA